MNKLPMLKWHRRGYRQLKMIKEIIYRLNRYNYILLISFTMILNHSIQSAECYYKLNDSSEKVDFTKQTICGKIIKNQFVADKLLLSKIQFDSYGLAGIVYDEKAYYINKDGKSIEVLLIEKLPDKFVEGYVRFSNKNKYGYINENLEIAIPAIYDYAFPFEGTSALVCNECKKEILNDKETILGGFWGMVNEEGEEIIPVQYDRRRADKDRREKEELDAQYKKIAEFEMMLKEKEEERKLKKEESRDNNSQENSPKKGFFETMYNWFSED
jgi:hypothetical protein